jgi:hypothetical protein
MTTDGPHCPSCAALRRGLEQIATGDYPASAGDAETWADNPLAVYWERLGWP